MPAEPTAGMAAGDSAPKATTRAGAGGNGKGGSGGRSAKGEKGVLVAAAEVVGRPLAVWSQKLLDWPKAKVADYRPESHEHLVRFDDTPGPDQEKEQWVRLGSIRFQWLREQPESAAPNPTAAGAPQGEDCLGRRLKVFWPGMGRWYQGKVQSYDPKSGKHCIKYRDGDIQELRLCHEAIIWVDVGPMPARQGSDLTSPSTKPKAAAAGMGGKGAGAQQKAAAQQPAAAGNGGGKAKRASPAPKRARPEESSSEGERLRSNKSSATREAAAQLQGPATGGTAPAVRLPSPAATKPPQAPASEQGPGGAAGGSSNIGSAFSSGQSMDPEDRSLAGSSSEGGSGDDEDDGDSSVVTEDLGSEVYSEDLEEEADSDFEVESGRRGPGGSRRQQQRRPGGAAGGIPTGRSSGGDRRKGGTGSRRNKKPGSGRPRKSGGPKSGRRDRRFKAGRDYGRAPVPFRPRPVALGAQASDEIVRMAGGSVVGARVAVLWGQDNKYYKGKLLQFDSYHKRSKILYDDGEEEWVSLPRETFRWLAPRGRSAGCAGEMREAMLQLGAQRDPDPSAAAAAAAAAAAPPSSPAVAQPACSLTPVGEVADVSSKGSPKAEAAVGWQVSVLFDGDGQWYRGEVLAFDRRRGRHLVLYDDGEDEWLQLERESLAWHKLVRGTVTGCPGVALGMPLPSGQSAVGWRVGVFWPLDMVFYTGELSAYDPATGKHTVVYDDGEVRSLSLTLEKLKWILPPGALVDLAKLIAAAEAGDPLTAARNGARRKAGGLAGESDPDFNYELEKSLRGSIRPRLPRLLTTASLAGPSAGAELSALQPGEASVAQLLQSPQAASPLWASLQPNRTLGSTMRVPLSPAAELPLGEPLLVRQLTRVPALGSLSNSSESETAPLPAPITVRIYMSGGSASGAGGGSGDAGALGGAIGGTAGALGGLPAGAAAGGAAMAAGKGGMRRSGAEGPPKRPRYSTHNSRAAALDLMTRRVMRAQHTLVKGVPTHLPMQAPMPVALRPMGSAPGVGLGNNQMGQGQGQAQQQQQQRYGPIVAGLHRLARASTSDHPLSPVHRRPHPAQSDEEASSSGSSDDEGGREASPAALLSPRSAAALNGAKIKPDQTTQQAQHDPMLDDELMLDASGAATPCDSDALGPIPPLLRPTHPGLDSPFSSGGLLRMSPGPPLQPQPVFSGRPLFPEGGASKGGGAAAAAMDAPGGVAGRVDGAAGLAGDGGGAAALGMARSMSLTGGMLDAIALPPAADPINGLLAMAGTHRSDSEFNLLAMSGPDLTPIVDDGGLMDLDVGSAAAAVGAGQGHGTPAAAVVGEELV